jgi:hypothetical protein
LWFEKTNKNKQYPAYNIRFFICFIYKCLLYQFQKKQTILTNETGAGKQQTYIKENSRDKPRNKRKTSRKHTPHSIYTL